MRLTNRRRDTQKHRIQKLSKSNTFRLGSLTALGLFGVMLLGTTAQAANTCVSIVHRAKNNNYPEETVPAIKAATKWKWGAELDARMTSDCKVVMVHDNTLKRIIDDPASPYNDWRPEEHTLSELRQVRLPGGYKIATVREAIQAAKNYTKYINNAKLMIEIKDWQEFGDRWQSCGLQEVKDWITYYSMAGRVFLGGSPGATNYIQATYPGQKVFWRPDPDDTPTKALVEAEGYKLVELPEELYSYYTQLSEIQGLTVATRNVWNTNDVALAYSYGFRAFQTNFGGTVNNYCNSQQN